MSLKLKKVKALIEYGYQYNPDNDCYELTIKRPCNKMIFKEVIRISNKFLKERSIENLKSCHEWLMSEVEKSYQFYLGATADMVVS